MIVALVTFRLSKPWTLEAAAAVFESTAPKYVGARGLVRKHYFLSENGDRAGGIYLWESRADAQACYTPEWKAAVRAKYGSPPRIEYFTSPVTVDNRNGTIETG